MIAIKLYQFFFDNKKYFYLITKAFCYLLLKQLAYYLNFSIYIIIIYK